jgi:hypothetical protein
MRHCALRRAWEGDLPAFLNVLVSPETGLVTLIADIAVGDWCIAVENDAGESLRPATRRDSPFLSSTPNSQES